MKFFYSVVEIKIRYFQYELICYQYYDVDVYFSFQERFICCLFLLFRVEEIVGGFQDCDFEIWDDLLFFESLNEFLVVIESEIVIISIDVSSRKCYINNDVDKLYVDYSTLFVIFQRIIGVLYILFIVLRFL